MSEIRDEMTAIIHEQRAVGRSYREAVDVILERFEVKAKPVVTPMELGRMVGAAYADIADYTNAGNRMFDQLEERGFVIVRKDEAQS